MEGCVLLKIAGKIAENASPFLLCQSFYIRIFLLYSYFYPKMLSWIINQHTQMAAGHLCWKILQTPQTWHIPIWTDQLPLWPYYLRKWHCHLAITHVRNQEIILSYFLYYLKLLYPIDFITQMPIDPHILTLPTIISCLDYNLILRLHIWNLVPSVLQQPNDLKIKITSGHMGGPVS